jgi:hypothetical protein
MFPHFFFTFFTSDAIYFHIFDPFMALKFHFLTPVARGQLCVLDDSHTKKAPKYPVYKRNP